MVYEYEYNEIANCCPDISKYFNGYYWQDMNSNGAGIYDNLNRLRIPISNNIPVDNDIQILISNISNRPIINNGETWKFFDDNDLNKIERKVEELLKIERKINEEKYKLLENKLEKIIKVLELNNKKSEIQPVTIHIFEKLIKKLKNILNK